MVSIAHWLDTFTCSKYADRFERSGFQNLHSVCQLTTAQLQTLGVANNDIYTIMENILLLRQSSKCLNTPPGFDLNSEPPPPPTTTRSRTGSPAINTLNRTMSQNPTAYSPGPHVSTPPASSGPSPDRILPGPPQFDTPSAYHRSNSYSNPVNPNTFFDISPSSSTSSPHRSTSIDALPPPMEPPPFNDYLPQPPPPPSLQPHQFQPPGMMYRVNNPSSGGGYYNPHPPRFYSPDQQQQQQQQFMYQNQRMMMHPQQHPPWGGHRQPLPPPPQSHPMHYHPYDHHQFRMAQSQQFCHPNHPIMSDQNQMFMNQQHQHQQQQNLNSSTSNKLSNTGETHPHPLQSLERLVLLPESQVIDPKSVVNEIHDPQSPFSESLSPYGTVSPKNSVLTQPTATIVSNLLTNEKSILDQHTKPSSGLKRSSTHDERNDLNKKNRMNTTNELNTGDSIISNHPVVTSLLTRGLNNSTSQAPLPSIKSLQQKHNPSFLQHQQQQQQQQMIFPQNQPDPQHFVDGLINEEIDSKMEFFEQDYEQLITKIRLTIDTTYKDKRLLNSNAIIIPSQLDGVSETAGVTSKSSNRPSRKRDLSTSSERGTSNSENRSSSPIKSSLNKSGSDPTDSSHNGNEKKHHGSLNNHHHKSSKRRLSENNLEVNHHSTNGHQSNSISGKIQKPKVIQSPSQSNVDDEISSSSESISQKLTTDNSSKKPIREAKKRSLIYTGNTRLFLATAIAAGLMDDNGDEEDEDNEYVPPGGTVNIRPQRSSSSSSENEDESAKSSDDSSGNDEEDENTSDENEDEKKSGDEIITNEEPSESGINWNVRNRPQRQTHLIRFDNISKQDEQKFFGALEEQVPELAAYLNENSDDDEYQAETTDNNKTKSPRKSTTKKSQRNQIKDTPEQDEQTVEIIKKFRHVNVPSERRTKKKSQPNESTTIPLKNRSDELYVMLKENLPRTVVSGTHLDTSTSTKKNSIRQQSFHFHRRQVKMNTVEDTKAPWRCILCWKEPYEEYLGPLFGPYQLNEQCQLYLNNNKQLAKHYRKLKEVWLHRDCALWNNHIQMNATTGELMHVSDACMTYLDITCSVCQIPGAAFACRYRNCKIRYHYPCAKTTVSCRLIEESYSVYCPKHNQINNNKSKKNRRKTTTSVNDSQETLMT